LHKVIRQRQEYSPDPCIKLVTNLLLKILGIVRLESHSRAKRRCETAAANQINRRLGDTMPMLQCAGLPNRLRRALGFG